MKKIQILVLCTVIASMALIIAGCGAPETPKPDAKTEAAKPAVSLDRPALLDLMHKYLAALVAHNPKAVPFAEKAKFVESTAEIPVGEGLWITAAEGPGAFQIYAADPAAQQVSCLVMMKEAAMGPSKDVLLGARLKVVDGKITEAEHLVIRDSLNMANLQKARPAFLEDLAPEDKTPREEMLKAGAAYYDALVGEDGKLAPFAADCERRENGNTTAGAREKHAAMPIKATDPATKKMLELMAKMPQDCEGQISTGAFTYITDIKNRRVVVADEQNGLVIGFSMFWHRSDIKEYQVKNVPGVDKAASFQGTFNLPAMHIYKIKKGKIYDIEAIGFTVPYGTQGWQD
jgi:hypothetical protein